MRWEKGERSGNIEDHRGEGEIGGGEFPGGGFPGGMGRRGGGGMRIGLGGVAVLFVLSMVTGQNFFSLLGPLLDTGAGPGADVAVDAGRGGGAQGSSPDEEKLVDFVSFVLDDVQTTWTRVLAKAGKRYADAKLVLFTDAVRSGCGFAESAMGPFYCPADQKVYIDLGFYGELKQRFGAPGDFAQAYVLAHEIGHHVQNLLGYSDWVQERQRSNPAEANALSIRLELQADCLAGVWGSSTQQRQILEQGDVEEGIGAAAAVGDDRIQKSATGRVNPETWTHGSARQRVEWFRRGLETGDLEACNTFRRGVPADSF